jgi:hypothetical protein
VPSTQIVVIPAISASARSVTAALLSTSDSAPISSKKE